jgi:hypothetical protein
MKINHALGALRVPIDTLSHDPENARTHSERNLEAIKFSLTKFGQQKPVVIKDGVVVAGNGMLQAARELGWTEIAAAETDITDAKLLKAYGIADNRTSELSEFDDGILLKALEELEQFGLDLVDLGFDTNTLADPVDPFEEWEGMPEFDHEDKTSFKQIHVHFKNVDDMRAFAKLVKQTITEKTRSIWYPEAEIERMMDKQYKTDAE